MNQHPSHDQSEQEQWEQGAAQAAWEWQAEFGTFPED